MDFKTYGPLATQTWCKHSWEFLQDNNITLSEDTPNLKLQCSMDKFLTPMFLVAGITGKQLL